MPQTVPTPVPLGPPQFGLRALLLTVSTAAVLLGLWQWMSPITYAALLFLLASIGAHVAGNVIGSRLRDGKQGKTVAIDQHEHAGKLRDAHFAPTTQLGHRHSLGWTPVLCALAGSLIGAAAGGWWTVRLLGHDLEWFPIVIAAGAFGALGGFGGFVVSGFCKALGDAWWEAAQPANTPEKETDLP